MQLTYISRNCIPAHLNGHPILLMFSNNLDPYWNQIEVITTTLREYKGTVDVKA